MQSEAAALALPDEAVIGRVLAGEPHLYEVLMRRHNRRLFRVARAILRDELEAEDVVQDAWVRAYDALRGFEGRARFTTWVTRICVNEALARARRGKRLEPLDPDHTEEATMPAATPEEQASDAEVRHVLERAIDELPEHFRTVFVMRTLEEMSVAETAECLGLTQETVKTRAFRARALLQRAIGERLDATAGQAFDFQGARCDRIVARVLARIMQGGRG
jgi:RNA polymerase sigma-70 factor (ECF subfamily)